MATLSEYFDTEAREFLAQLERGLQRSPLPDPGELHRAVRGLRGTAQMAREERVFRVASAFEAATRALATNALAWSEEMAARTQHAIADVRALVERDGDDASLDERADACVRRWQEAGFTARDAAPAAVDGSSTSSEFRAFAAREVAGIADALDTGVQQLAASPMDREPLKMILRRQRALLGAARLDEIPVVAEILRAVEDLTRVIAKLDVGVKQEWLDIYRVAREGLRSAVEPLETDQDPQPTHSLSRLRHMREELLERYGAGEAVSAAHQSEGLVQAERVTEPPAPVQLDEPEQHEQHEQHAHFAQHEQRAGEADDDDRELPLLELVDEAPGGLDVSGATEAFDASGATEASDASYVSDDSDDSDGIDAPELLLLEEVADEPMHDDDSDDGSFDLVAAAANALMRAGPAAETAAEDAVDIGTLCYAPAAALARAAELRDAIEPTAQHDHAAREAVEELFDLIRIAQDG